LYQSEPVFAFLSKSLDLLKQSISDRERRNSKTQFSTPNIFERMALSFDRFASSKSLNAMDRDVAMDAMAQPLYNLIFNVFELTGGSNWLRRTLVALVQVTYGKSINRKIHETVEWIVSEPMLIYYLHLFRDAYWPPHDQPTHRTTPPSDEEKRQMRLLAKQKLLNSIPAALKNLIGDEKARHGATKLFDAWQDSQINKHIFYTVLEMFMMEIFADSKNDERSFVNF
jgi:sorting nexin-25